MRSRYRFVAGLLAWVLVLGGGFGWLIAYQMQPGAPARAPETWPGKAGLVFDAKRTNLVMFAHPQCPCSQASLEELKVVLTEAQEQLKATLCFFDPPGAGPSWTETSLVRDARSVPGLEVVIDREGRIAAKFGVLTSGQILVFDRDGRRAFAGGITSARGHAGPNRGRSLVLALAKGEFCTPEPTPVYGCGLYEPPKKDPPL